MANAAPLPALQDITPLKDICDQYLGMCFTVARRRHALGTLPVKAFRLNDGRRGPLYVHNDDLEKLIQRRRTRAVAAPAPAAASQ
jgi:hypothetical protein